MAQVPPSAPPDAGLGRTARAEAGVAMPASVPTARDAATAGTSGPIPLSRAVVLLLLAAGYFGAAKLGLMLAIIHASATAVWPPTGIALAGLLILGYGAWPAIAVGAFVANLTTHGTAATCLGIAAGNTLEALAGAWRSTRG